MSLNVLRNFSSVKCIEFEVTRQFMCGTEESIDCGIPTKSIVIHCIFCPKSCAVVLCFKLPVECGPI